MFTRSFLVGSLALSAVAAMGCSAESGESTDSSAEEALGSASIYGTHTTCWREDEGDEGPIPYRAITLNQDGTFEAAIEQDDPRAQAASDWVAQHPSATVKGTWKRTTETLTTGKPRTLDFITFTEDGSFKWIYDGEDTEQAHTFKVWFRTGKRGAYYLGWDDAYYVNPEYVPKGAKCRNTNVNAEQ